MNYGQVKTDTLRLIDEYSSRGAIQAASKIADIKFKIQSATNQTIYDLASTTAKIPAVFNIAHNPIKNVLMDDTSSLKQHLPGMDFTISLAGAKSCFFECTGPATVQIEEGNTILQTISIPSSTKVLTDYRRLITPVNPNSLITLRFTGDYVYTFRNYTLYPYSFPTEADIQQHRPWFEYDLPNDYLDINNVFAKKDARQYSAYPNYILTPNKKISFNAFDGPLELLVNYWRRPNLLTFVNDDTTDDAQIIDLSEDAAMIIPFNVAGQVLNSEKQLAEGTLLLNQYETKKSTLISNKTQYQANVMSVYGM
jgi:hypothetical protein